MPTNPSTTQAQQISDLVAKFSADLTAIVSGGDRAARKAARHAKHPAEPRGASLVKVFFTGDKDGNHFAVCHPTEEFKRIRVDGYTNRQSRRMWKYTYETQTGTAQKRSWVGMLKTLDGHGREATRIEIYRPSGAEIVDLTA